MSYQAPLPNTGAILPVLGSGQAWEGSVYNGNFAGVEAAVAADRARLTTIEGKLVGNGLVPAGTSAARDGLYGVPSNAAARVALANAAPRWFNTDAGKNYTQQYFAQDGDAGAGVNTRTTAGWYAAIDSGRVPLSGIAAAITGGALTRDGGALICGGGTTALQLNTLFTTDFAVYDFEIELQSVAATDLFWQACIGGSPVTATVYNRNRFSSNPGNTSSVVTETTQIAGAAGRIGGSQGGIIDFSLINPASAAQRTLSKYQGYDNENYLQIGGAACQTAATHDGIKFLVSSSSFAGRFRVYGRNPF